MLAQITEIKLHISLHKKYVTTQTGKKLHEADEKDHHDNHSQNAKENTSVITL